MKNCFVIIAFSLSLALAIPAMAATEDACQELNAVKEQAAGLKKRNKFLDVKNSQSNQAPSYLESQTKQLEEKCKIQIAAAEKKETEMMAQPAEEVFEDNK